MQHLDPEQAALAALGEQIDAAVREHLALCEACRGEVEQLQATVDVARSTLGESTLESPPARVWSGIRTELGFDASLDFTALPTGAVPIADRLAEHVAGAEQVAGGERRAAIRSLEEHSARRRTRRVIGVVLPALAAAAAAAIITAIALGALPAAAPSSIPLAAATLEPLPAWPDASGDAVLVSGEAGRVIEVRLDAPAADDRVREVWLLTPDVDGLISLGLLEGDSGTFVVPDSVNLSRYSVVDISAEPVDGDPAHSGDSIVRGALES